MESIGACEGCGEPAEWWLETARFRVSLDHGIGPAELVEQVPVCDECMAEMTEDEEEDEDE